METILFIDGENFKNKIKCVFRESGKERPIWHQYNFKGLLDKVLKGIDVNKSIFYFARIKENKNTIEKSKQLIEEQRQLKTHLEKQGFSVLLSGSVRGHMEMIGKKEVLVFREKGVDVKIAVDIVSLVCDNLAKTIILGSSDSDLQPAIAEVKKREANCIYLGFELQPNKGLSYTTGKTILIRDSEVLEFEIQKSLEF